MELEKFNYDNKIVKYFAYATLIWGLTGMLVGLLAATQIAWPNFYNDYLGIKYLSFGRIRPLHTNAVIFAFVGNATFTGVYYSMQRLLKTRMWNDKVSYFNFWGWQAIILIAAITLPLGYTTSKEYAELEWWVDILIALVWVSFGLNMIMTMVKRRVQHLYVAIWFYVATFVAVALLHIFNSFEIPVSFMKSYSWYSGVQDALVQWWYGHNAVAFFLTTPFLGLMYYFVPKAVKRPVYSYKLSIIHFWTLIFLYMWAGPHHLLYSSLPDWAQNLGTTFSVMLLMPSWGGMLNGLLTMRGAWDRVRDKVELKFFVVAITCYGMSTFEGPMLSLKFVNIISHFTDWTIAHVHVGALGWNGMLTFGMMYWLFPKMWKTKLYSQKMANFHFWIATIGILLYAIPMYWAGFTQGSMWQAFDPDGKLTHPEFLDTVVNLMHLYELRAIGGLLYLTGAVVGTINLFKTAKSGSFANEEAAEAAPLVRVTSKHMLPGEYWHNVVERKPIKFTILVLLAVGAGGFFEIIPVTFIDTNIPKDARVQPYTPLELEGRDIYVREGCYTCHSQMVRPTRFETERYGPYSVAAESVYDHPFQFGSKRTGPDLAREGTAKLKRPNIWHYKHLKEPKEMSQGSLMPNYTWLIEEDLDLSLTDKKISAMRTLDGIYQVGYEYAENGDDSQAVKDLKMQAQIIAADIVKDAGLPKDEQQAKVDEIKTKEVIAVIAYLQRLGTDIMAEKK